MSNRCFAAALAAVLGSVITACSAAAPPVTSAGESPTLPASTTIKTDSGAVTVPAAATGGTTGSGSGSTGPNEKEKQRGNTPPGMSRDGAGPAGGAILDPTGAATGNR